jgi:hypothetical protein
LTVAKPQILRRAIVAAILAASAGVHGADKAQRVSERERAIAELQLAASMCSSEIVIGKLSAEAGAYDKVTEARGKAMGYKRRMEEAAAPAVKAAKGNADLAKAVKEFYQAAATYCEGGIPTSRLEEIQSSRLESEYQAKSKALDLELQLAK